MSLLYGEIAEQKFKLLMLENGYPIYKPLIDDIGVDFIIEIGYRLVKIQVKSTISKNTGDRYKINTSKSTGNKYDKSDFDYLVAYLHELDVWYIFPSDLITSKSIRLNPNSTRGKYNCCKEAWGLLK